MIAINGGDDSTLGKALIDAGWRQGAIFDGPSLCYSWDVQSESDASKPVRLKKRHVRQKEKLVLITQDCDIHASAEVEPYVEALICEFERNQNRIESIDRNSSRWFVISRETGLVAQARYRVQLSKRTLALLSPEPWPADADRLYRFVRWLARRYDRPAIPDPLVQSFQRPVEAALNRLQRESPSVHSAFNRVVAEVRVSMPVREEPPFELNVVLLAKSWHLTQEEADAISIVSGVVRKCCDPTKVLIGPEIALKSDDQITLAEIKATRPIFLEYLTYLGDEIEGAEPPPRV